MLLQNCSRHIEAKNPPIASTGTIDLTHWDFEKNGPLELNGQWEFYWKKLLSPGEIQNHKPGYINVPMAWHNKIINNEKLPKTGYATYLLKLISPKKQQLHLYFDPPDSCNKLFFNGKVLKQDGSAYCLQNFPKVKRFRERERFGVSLSQTVLGTGRHTVPASSQCPYGMSL